MKHYLKLILLFIIFLVIMIIKRKFFPSEIIFYEGIYMAFIFCVLVFFFKKLNLDKTLVLFLISIYFWSIVPTILDRSVSITVLGSLSSSKQLTIEELNTQFIRTYVYDNEAVKKRILEQKFNKNINLIDNKYFLTKKGDFTKKIIIFTTELFNIPTDYISPNN